MEVLQRVHEPEKNNDSLKYQLFNLHEDKIVLTGTSVAFSDKPRINSFDIYYESLKNADNYKNSLKLCEYPLDKHLGYLDKLSSEQLIIQYYDSQDVFELKFIHDHFELCKAQIPKGRNEWENLHTSKIMDFESIPEFWLFLTASNWYSRYNLRFKHYSIEKYIIEEHNRIVKERIVPQIEYSKLHNWMNVNYNHDIERNVYWQFCSNCRERVFYNPRYPNHVCNKCVMLIEDNIGNVLDYRTTHELKYIDGRFKVLLKNTDEEVNISIGNVAYYASEAHFGGIVHQLQE